MICENCNTKLVGEYCHSCGQSGRPIQTNFTGFLHDLFTNLLGTDSRVLRSLYRLVLFPGHLTREWNEGHRSRYTSPIQLYLLLAGVFFLLNAYSPFIQFVPEDHSVVSSLAGATVGDGLSAAQLARLDAAAVSLDVFKERFDTRVSALLGPLLIVTVVLFSFLTGAVARRGRPFAQHAVFSLHWCSFFLLLELIYRTLGGGVIWEVATIIVGLAYLAVATSRVYGGWVRGIFTGLLLMLCFLFLIGLWMFATLWIALP